MMRMTMMMIMMIRRREEEDNDDDDGGDGDGEADDEACRSVAPTSRTFSAASALARRTSSATGPSSCRNTSTDSTFDTKRKTRKHVSI
jgi:hypothetical protein